MCSSCWKAVPHRVDACGLEKKAGAQGAGRLWAEEISAATNVGPPLVGEPLFERKMRHGGKRQPYTKRFLNVHSRDMARLNGLGSGYLAEPYTSTSQ